MNENANSHHFIIYQLNIETLQLMVDAVSHDPNFWIDVNFSPGSDEPEKTWFFTNSWKTTVPFIWLMKVIKLVLEFMKPGKE